MAATFSGPDRRREPRYPVNLPVTFVRGATRCAGTCLDLSHQGLLVELAEDVDGAEAELVRVEVAPPDEKVLLLTAVITRRVGRKLGLLLFGVSGDPLMVWQALVVRISRTRSTPPR